MQNTAGGGGGGRTLTPLHPYTPAIFGYKNPTTHVLRQSVSEALVTRMMPEPRVSGCSDFQGIPLTNYIA